MEKTYTTELRSVIDVGTNSVKFLVLRKTPEGFQETLIDKNDIVRLGEGLRETGRISSEAAERNARTIAGFVEEAKDLGVPPPEIVGTMALRTASNASEFIDLVRKRTGIEIRVISGEEEARLSYAAAVSGVAREREELVSFDTGGGSTEFVYGRGNEMLRKISVPVGAVSITEEFFASETVIGGAIDAALEEIGRILEEGGVDGSPDYVVGMGGTVTSLVSVKLGTIAYSTDAVHGHVLTLDEVDALIARFASLSLSERKTITGLQPKRAEVILGGACIVRALLERLTVSSFTVSDRGLRHALAEELFAAGGA